MDVDSALALLAEDANAPLDLAELALALARDEYPDLDVEAHLAEVAGMAHEARPYVRGDLIGQVRGLSRYLFHDLGFRGNQPAYYDPRNSYFNQVLDRRIGIPITLSAVAMVVGQRAGLQVVGVGLPGHFVVKAIEGTREVVFDPYHGGRRLTAKQCEMLIRQVSGTIFQATPETLQAVPLAAIVQRMLTNLKGAYLRTGDLRRAVRVIERIRQLNPGDGTQRRDLGACLLKAGYPGRAVDHLSAYLHTQPHADDREAVRRLLYQALGEVARWN